MRQGSFQGIVGHFELRDKHDCKDKVKRGIEIKVMSFI
jgi:hypothetical protein